MYPSIILSLAVAALVLSPTSLSATLLVANKSEASVSLHRLPDGKELARLPTGEGPHEVAVSPDGRFAVVTDYGTREIAGGTLTVVDVPKARVIRTINLAPGSRPHGIEWLDDDTVAVTAEGIRSLLLVNVESGEVETKIAIDQDVAHMLALSQDTGRAFVANIGSGTATAVDLKAGAHLENLEAGAGSEGIAVARDGTELWVTNRGDDSVTIFSTESLEKLADIPMPGFPIRARADDARGVIYVTQPKVNALSVINVDQRELQQRIDFDIGPDTERKTLFSDVMPDSSIPIGVLLSGDGKTLYVAHTNAHLVSVWDAQTLEFRGTIATGLEPDGMAWSPLDVVSNQE